MQERIKIKHPGPRGWASIVKSAFDPEKHDLYEGVKPATAPATPATNIEVAADDEAQAARLNLTDEQIEAMDVDELRQQLDGMGVDYHPRNGAPALREKLSGAIAEARG